MDPPILSYNEHKGREKALFHASFDFETRFLNDGNDEKTTMIASMCHYHIFFNDKIYDNFPIFLIKMAVSRIFGKNAEMSRI